MKVVIEAQRISEPSTCEGETIVVNCHGALILATVMLRVGMRIEVRVVQTDKRALADVVYVDPEQPHICGIGLGQLENIWGLSVPPDDWSCEVKSLYARTDEFRSVFTAGRSDWICSEL
jgi:hypothetical protein